MEKKSILEDITEHDVVEVKNPFNEVFKVKVARSVVAPARQQNVQTGHSEADAFMRGIQSGISKGGHTSMVHVQQEIVFNPNQSMRLPGDVARVAVNQMVREYMQRQSRAHKKENKLKSNAILIADPHAYMEVERMIVKNSESMLENMSVESVEERLKRQLDELNGIPEVQDAHTEEHAFPTETGNASPTGEANTQRARIGRPPKQTAAAN